MEVQYIRNLNHNYVKVQSEEEFFEYQVQMITRNNIEGLLGCVVERVDNKIYFLYEINSRQPFVQLFERKKMNYDAFRALLICIKNSVDNVGEYLLDVNSLVIAPEYIFMNPETKEVRLIYLPGAWQNIKDEFRELSVKILDWIDYKDEQVVTAAYELHRRTLDENYSLEEILEIILKKDRMDLLENRVNNLYYDRNDEQRKLNDNSFSCDIDYGNTGYLQDEFEDSIDDKTEKYSLFKKLTNPILEAAENIINGLGFINREEKDVEEDEYESDLENLIKYEDYTENYKNYSMVAEEEETYGNTVFFKAASDKKKRLMPQDSDKFSMFELDIFPFIIGKLSEAVDGVIDEESVSRIHAKIEKTDSQYYLVDLNSTNGTFINGQMIFPNEKTKLQPGDRIQFGFVEYHFENE